MTRNQEYGIVEHGVSFCPVCESTEKILWVQYSSEYDISECNECGLGYVDPYLQITEESYVDYGDYITQLPSDYFENRNKVTISKYIFFSLLKIIKGKNINLIDYGGGAGFFVSSARKMGLRNSMVFEPSENFRRAAIERVGLPPDAVKPTLESFHDKFDFVSMLDVIEHLPEDKIKILLNNLTKKLNHGAILFGETPNKKSWNLFLYKKRDPVISLPGHVLYFDTKSLDKLLKGSGFRRKFIFTKGMSHNAIFRTTKFQPSYIERPNGWRELLLSKVIKIGFSLAGLIASSFGGGYHIIFAYEFDAHQGSSGD